MKSKTIILLKLTGELLKNNHSGGLDGSLVKKIARQIVQLQSTHHFGIVIGGGNFFRGNKQGVQLGLSLAVGHQVGMVATLMNGLIVKDLFEQEGLPITLFSAMASSEIGVATSAQNIKKALEKGDYLIFAGGTGNPFFSTDTTAIVRGLQIGADCVWKATNVDGIYDSDPRINSNAYLLSRVSYSDALSNNLKILDATAFALAKENSMKIRVFNVFRDDALLEAASNNRFGTVVENNNEYPILEDYGK